MNTFVSGRSGLAYALFLSLAPALAHAGDAAGPACVDVEVDGRRALAVDCLNRQLTPTPAHAPALPPQLPLSERRVADPSNQLGLFNRAATSNRMGSNFGKSVTPFRPAAPPAVNTLSR